ncbi:uncharacterized protein LOC141686257 [Apium graveolens]|uniref:uncharacterized protein LOC141686257 n=1 Tax=Apium graveolens TaxID=4045 RepID=UPI003D79FDBF
MASEAWTEVRWDRALTSASWLDLFPSVKLYNLEGSTSDHSPILLVPEEDSKFVGQRHFRFENTWLTEPMCRQLVFESWEMTSSMDIQTKVKICGENLYQRGKEITGKFSARIKNCKSEMKKYRKGRDIISVQKYKDLKSTLIRILEQQEILWRQRSKQLWL